MNYMLRILGPLAAFAVIFGLAYCTQSAEEIYNRTDNFFVDTETERSFAFHLNNYTQKPLDLDYRRKEGIYGLGGLSPYAEWGGGQCCVSIPRWYEGMTLPLILTVSHGPDSSKYLIEAKVDKFTDEDNGLLQFHVLPDYSVRVLISEYGRGRQENPMYPLYQSIEKDMDEYNQQHPLF